MQSHAHSLSAFLLLLLLSVVVSPRLGSAQKLTIGEPAPDFTVASVDGRSTIRLSDFRGRRVLIFDWATW